MILLLPFILALFFISSSLYIWKKSHIFFLFYLVLFVYTFFTQVAYLFYPDKLDVISHYQYYGEEPFIYYWSYIFLAFILIFLLFIVFYNKKYKTIFNLQVKTSLKKPDNLIYSFLILFYIGINTFFLAKNYENLSYVRQGILKNNTIWFYLFSLGGIFLLSLFYKIYIETKRRRKLFYSILFLFTLSVFSLTAIRAGQRIQIAMGLLGLIASLYYLFKDKIKFKHLKLKYIFVTFFIFFVAVSFFQGIRIIRGHDETFSNFFITLKRPQIYLSVFQPENLVFQDWLFPSLTLITSMERNIIFPVKVIESNLKCLIPFISHRSLGSTLSRVIDPEGIQGYGYYIFTEGYNLMGFVGFIYSAFIFVLGIRILESFFARTNDKVFNSYMYGIMGVMIIGVVRGGQTMIFLKSLYLYFLPAIILFVLLSGKKICLYGPKIGEK